MTTSLDVRKSQNHVFNVGESAIRGYSEKPDVSTSQVSAEAPLLPLSEGEYDEPIGLPLVVVCQNVALFPYIG